MIQLIAIAIKSTRMQRLNKEYLQLYLIYQ